MRLARIRVPRAVLAACATIIVGPAYAGADTAANRPPSSDGDPGKYVVLGTLALNTAFTVYNVATIGDDKAAIYGFGETLVALPQALVWGGIALIADGSDGAWIPATFALWTAGLTAHGIYTLASKDGESAERQSDRTVILSFGGRF